MKVGALDFTPLCSILTFAWVMAIPFLICMLPNVGMVKYIFNVTLSMANVDLGCLNVMVYPSLFLYLFHQLFFPCSHLIGGTTPTSLLV